MCDGKVARCQTVAAEIDERCGNDREVRNPNCNQQLVANAYLLPGRTDIKCDKRSNLEDIPQITPDWDKMMAEASDDAAKINQICGASNG